MMGMMVLADAVAQVTSGPALVIPIALVVVGIGIIGTLLRLTWVVSSSATKIMIDVEQLTGSMKSLQIALVAEREERNRLREKDREEINKLLDGQSGEIRDLRHTVDEFTSKVHGLAVQFERGNKGG